LCRTTVTSPPDPLPARPDILIVMRLLLGAVAVLGCVVGEAQAPAPQQLFQEAVAAQQRGDDALAVEKYRALLALQPDVPEIMANLGAALSHLGRYEEAIAEYSAALEKRPGDAALSLNLALARLKKGDLAEAASLLRALAQADPANARLAALLGGCYFQMGRYGDAIAVLEPAEAAHPDDLNVAWALGSALIRYWQPREGLERVEKVAVQGNNAEAWLLAGQTWLDLNEFDKALAASAAALQLNRSLPGALTLSGKAKSRRGDYPAAQADLEAALAVNPDDFEAHLALGTVLAATSHLDEAQPHVERALKISPNSTLARLELGRIERSRGDLASAVRDIENVAAANPDWLQPHVELAELYARVNRPEDGARERALADRLTARQAAGGGAGFDELVARASAARRAQDPARAKALYRQALEKNASWAEGWRQLGMLAYEAGEFAAGREAFGHVTQLAGEAASGWAYLGLCEFETGEYAGALEHIQRALALDDGLPRETEERLRLREALLLTRQGFFDQALPRYSALLRHGAPGPELLPALGLNSLRRAMLPKEIPDAQQDLVTSAGRIAALWIAGDTRNTEAGFQDLLARFGKEPGVHYFYGSCLLGTRPAEARGEFQRELAISPDSADANAMVALVMISTGSESTALPYALRAARDGPSVAVAQYVYGLLLAHAGDAKAIPYLETAGRLDPTNVEYHIALASAYSRFGRYQDSVKERRTSIALAKETGARGEK
jgi:tetratricopeptide (TPR) repeat protein